MRTSMIRDHAPPIIDVLPPPAVKHLLAAPADDPPMPASATAVAGGRPVSSVAPSLSDEVVLLLLADIVPAWRAWGWWRIARGAQCWRGVPGLRLAKTLGSGFEGGFGLRPSVSRQGVFLVFSGPAEAERFLTTSPAVQAYRERADDFCVITLRAWSARGSWGGQTLSPSTAPPPADSRTAPVAALTRASIRPGRASAFWRLAPATQAAIESAPGCLLAVGLGEAPLLRQATFSLWTSVSAMDAYARSGAHLTAIREAHRAGYFSESMFVRFVPVSMRGRWKGSTYGDGPGA
jgi:spheroidene monooxygenase